METTTSPLRLDAFHNQNWRVDAAAVAILNEASTHHEKIAYCWGLADQLHGLAMFLAVNDNESVRRMSSLFLCHLTPLVCVLERLGTDSAYPAPVGGSEP